MKDARRIGSVKYGFLYLVTFIWGVGLIGCRQGPSENPPQVSSPTLTAVGMGYPEPEPGMQRQEVIAMKGIPVKKKEAVFREKPVTVFLYRDPLPDSIRTDITGSTVDYVYDPHTQQPVEIEAPLVESVRVRRYLITQVVFQEGEVIAVDYSQQSERDY